MNKREKNEINQRIGNKIRIAREARGLTLEELAYKIGYNSRASMSVVELGKRSITTNRAQLIAEALRVDVLWLISDEDTPPVFIEQSPIEDLFEKLTDDNKKNAMQYINFLIKQQEDQGNE